MPTIEEVSAIKKSFEAEFWKPPWEKYISSIGISTVDLWSESEAQADQKYVPCIAVGLVRRLPKKIIFPSTYKNIPVVLLVTGRSYFLSG